MTAKVLLVALITAFCFVPATASRAQAGIQCQDGVDNDGDGLVDLQDPGCSDAADATETLDSNYDIPVRIVPVAVPVVTIVGAVAKNGTTTVKRFEVQGARGTVIDVKCAGSPCPFSSRSITMQTTSQRITGLERKLKPNLTLTVRAATPSSLGKYLQYKIRKNKAPSRTDSCVLDGKVRSCFAG